MTAVARSRTETPAAVPDHPRARSVAGLLLLIAGSAVLLGIVTAEVLYPAAYNVHRNTVSDLGAMRPENIVRQPSAAIFNTTMIVAGALIAVAAVLLYRSRAGLLASLPVAGLGIGMIGVGFFPGNTVMAVHQLVSVRRSCAGRRGDHRPRGCRPGRCARCTCSSVESPLASCSATRSWAACRSSTGSGRAAWSAGSSIRWSCGQSFWVPGWLRPGRLAPSSG